MSFEAPALTSNMHPNMHVLIFRNGFGSIVVFNFVITIVRDTLCNVCSGQNAHTHTLLMMICKHFWYKLYYFKTSVLKLIV